MTEDSARAERPARSSGKRLALILLLGAAFLGFVSLGTWQVERRAWKLALIDRVEARVHAPAVAAPGPGQWRHVAAATDEYRHVRATGRYLADADTLVQAVTRLGAGFWVLTPLRCADGSLVLINRGFVASARPRPAPASPVTVGGLLRLPEPGGGFLRRNDATAGRWYSRDVAAIAQARGWGPVAPYFIDAEAAPGADTADTDEPAGGLTVVDFPNNHLSYAITWYVLAALSLVAGWLVLTNERRARRLGA